jgi:predicted ATPase/DNA-binding SARP family transcriptional activator
VLRLWLFGRAQATDEGAAIQIGSRKALALLVYLAVQGGAHHRDTLAGLLWPEQGQAQALAGLRQALYTLRRSVAKSVLEADRQLLGIIDDALWIDLREFDALTAATSSARAADAHEDDVARLERAVTLVQGDFMRGFSLRDCPAFDEWQALRSEEYRRKLKDVLRTLVGWYTGERKLERAIDHGRHLLLLDPYDQTEHRRLMVLLTLADHQAAALRQHATLAKLLEDDLGIEPDDETTELHEAIKRGDLHLLLRRMPAGAPLSELAPLLTERRRLPEGGAVRSSQQRPRSNLPPQPSVFVGRQRDLQDLSDLLANPAARLITIVAPGGMGKTRLALAAAERQLAHGTFTHGVFFVPLAPVQGVPFLARAIADAMGLKLLGTEDAARQLLRQLPGRSLLLVLDSFEHLLSATGFVSELLAHAPDLTVLVTSRERLNAQEEWLYQLWGLEVPTEDLDADGMRKFSAIDLFERCAKKAKPKFDLGRSAHDVARICRHLQGMPLGIELAAAWVTTIPCKDIADEIEKDLGFLETRAPTIADRHRSLKTVFEYAWHQASEAAQATFEKLSVFRGGFTRQAAEQVAGATLPILASLAEMAFIRLRDSGRYDVHELLRQFAEAKLRLRPNGHEEAAQAHARHFADLLAELEPDLKSARQFRALDDVAADGDNVLTTWQWATSHHDVTLIDKLAMGFFLYCDMRGLAQMGDEVFQRAIDALGGLGSMDERATATLAKLLAGQEILRTRMGFDSSMLQRRLTPLLPTLSVHDPLSCVYALTWHATGLPYRGRHAEAEALLDRAENLARRANDTFSVAHLLQTRGHNLYIEGRFLEAEPIFAKCLSIFDACGDRRFKASGLNNASRTAIKMGSYDLAATLNAEGLAIRRLANDPLGEAASLIVLGRLKTRLGQYDLARQHLEDAAGLMRQSNNYQYWSMMELDELQLDIELEDHERARERFQQTRPRSGSFHPYYEAQRLHGAALLSFVQHDVVGARSQLDGSLALAHQLGYRHDEAKARHLLGLIDLAAGNAVTASDHFKRSLDICRATGAAPLALDVLKGWCAFESGARKLDLLTLIHRDTRATHHTREAARRELLELAPTVPAEPGCPDLWQVVDDLA